MCKNILSNGNRQLRTPYKDGSRVDPKLGVSIVNHFKVLSEERDTQNTSKLGFACAIQKCCFENSSFVEMTDCNYYE